MSSLFPIRSTVDARGDDEPRLLRLDSEDAGPVLDALSSDTARKVMAAVHEEPGTKSDLADRVDTSLQNVSYHLENLEEAGLVAEVDTWYSSRGREMPVYGPDGGPVVVYAGDDDPTPGLRRALTSAIGTLAVVGVLSAVVQWLFQQRPTGAVDVSLSSRSGGDGGGGAGGGGGGADTADGGGGDDVFAAESADEATEAPETVTETAGDAAANASDGAFRAAEATTRTAAGDGGTGLLAGAGDWLASLPPGALFFAGGLVVLALGLAWWYVGRR